MLNFLKQSRKYINTKQPICIVLGNESCDLDSAVCAISLAYFYQNNENRNSHISTRRNYLPILNIPKRDYPLKTEVKYIFEKINITQEFLTFKDELDEEFLSSNTFVLVDHHVSPYLKKCIAIYDHRQKDDSTIMPNDCVVNLSLVGSCATLIGEEFVNSNLIGEAEKDILHLLRSTIVLDTVNFSESAARATRKDSQICLALEEALQKFGYIASRDEIFQTLVKARADISSLTASQLLKKDFKILTSSKNENIKVALPGFPLPVQQFILKSNAEEAVIEFAEEFKCCIVLLLGMYVQPEDNSVHRDLGVINISATDLYESIRKSLLSDHIQLSPEDIKDCNFMGGSFFRQHNIKVTRKHLLPIVKSILDQ